MAHYIEIDATGRVLRAGNCQPEALEYMAAQSVHTLIEVPEQPADIATIYWHGGGLHAIPERPSDFHQFDYASKSWQDPRTLQDFKDAKWAETKAARAAAEFGGLLWDGSLFDSDEKSQARIQGAVQLAAMAPAFAVDWTLADNTVRTLSAADVLALGMALGAHVAQQHTTARAVREHIEMAASVAEVLAITWPASAD